MRKILSLFTSLSLVASTSTLVTSCAGAQHAFAYGQTGVFKSLLAIDEKSIAEYSNAQTLYEYIEGKIANLNEITLVNDAQAETTETEQVYNQKNYHLEMHDNSGTKTKEFGNKDERRFIYVTYSEQLVKGILSESGGTIEAPQVLVKLASDFASFAIINK